MQFDKLMVKYKQLFGGIKQVVNVHLLIFGAIDGCRIKVHGKQVSF